jgi:hypothetical protein
MLFLQNEVRAVKADKAHTQEVNDVTGIYDALGDVLKMKVCAQVLKDTKE